MRTSLFALPLLALLLAACTHVKGTVTDLRNRPLASAKLSIGRPDGVGAYAIHSVNERGEFDFHMLPVDDNALYVYDGSGNPSLTMRRIDRSELSSNMTLRIQPLSPDMLPGMNINP